MVISLEQKFQDVYEKGQIEISKYYDYDAHQWKDGYDYYKIFDDIIVTIVEGLAGIECEGLPIIQKKEMPDGEMAYKYVLHDPIELDYWKPIHDEYHVAHYYIHAVVVYYQITDLVLKLVQGNNAPLYFPVNQLVLGEYECMDLARHILKEISYHRDNKTLTSDKKFERLINEVDDEFLWVSERGYGSSSCLDIIPDPLE